MSKLFTTNGMLIVDEIYTQPGQHYNDILGGGGTYAILGSCIVKDGLSEWIVDRGTDFPSDITNVIKSWNSGSVFRDSTKRLTTRGVNHYGKNELREFEYLTPKRQICVEDWIEMFGQSNVVRIRCFHLVCSPERLIDIVETLSKVQDYDKNNVTFVWEPLPDSMKVANQEIVQGILNRGEHIIISPNSEEAARLLGLKEPDNIEECAELAWKYDALIKNQNSCILRCGKLGSIVLSEKVNGTRKCDSLPAYHRDTPLKVIDPTGGGNSFLGGFCMGYILSNDLQIANICGNIAASSNIEQLGVAEYDSRTGKSNGLGFRERLDVYIKQYKLHVDMDDICDRLYN